jgi:hypothetical protein
MQFEMWLRPSSGGELLFATLDAAEMYVHYKDALRMYRRDELQLLAGSEWDVWEIEVSWLRKLVLAK